MEPGGLEKLAQAGSHEAVNVAQRMLMVVRVVADEVRRPNARYNKLCMSRSGR